MNRIQPRDAALRIVRRLREEGHTAFWAGGCVRDMLLGTDPKDYDVATNALPERVVDIFRHTRKVGAQFGVVLVRMGRVWTEVATFRSDLPYEDGRHPRGVVFSTPQEDARRRDFTINGLFYDPIERRVVDYVDGQTDIRARVIRAIGDPDARFREDHLRLIRAVRFAARLGFAIEPRTRQALGHQASSLRRVSPERVREELALMFESDKRVDAFQLLAECNLLPYLWEGADWNQDRIDRRRRTLSHLCEPVSFELALAVLLEDTRASACRSVCRALACSNASRRRICWLVARCAGLLGAPPPDLAALKILMAGPGFDELMNLYRARLMADGENLAPWTALRRRADAVSPESVRPDPLVRGDDLINAGLQPGPAFRQILEQIYLAQLREEIRSRSEGLTLMWKCIRERP